MLLEEAVFKAAASLLSGVLGAFVLAGSRRRAANVFLASFLFLLAGNQFAETMRALAPTTSGRLFWFRIASVFAFLDPLALYGFGSVFPDRNRLNRPLALAGVVTVSVGLTLTAPFLQLDWLDHALTGTVLITWAVFTLVTYSVVLWEAIAHARRESSPSGAAELVPALCVITLPSLVRVVDLNGAWLAQRDLAVDLLAVLAVLAATGLLLALARRTRSQRSRRLVAIGAVTGLAFTVIANQGTFARLGDSAGLWEAPLLAILVGGGDALKLFTFGVLASAAILRHRMLDLSLGTRRWAARLLAGAFVVVGLAVVADLASRAGSPSLLVEPAVLGLFLVVLVATEGFRRLVDAVAEKAYGVPRESRTDKIETYRAAVQQAREEGRAVGSDPRLRRLREELGLGEHTATVVERMREGDVGGPLVPGERLQGRYRIESFLGRGGGGRAFRARDELLDRDVAVKEVLDGGAHETARALREARLAGQLDHPNVITVHDVLQRPGASLLVTEFASDGSLAERLEERGPLPQDRAFAVLDGILSGLEAVHGADVVHGDLKPSNVLLDGGVPKITDFGASQIGDRTLGAGDAPSEGTPAYMAPEQRDGARPTERSDVYAVGLLAGELWRPPIPDQVEVVLRRARASDPSDRFASASAMREALRQAAETTVRSGR